MYRSGPELPALRYRAGMGLHWKVRLLEDKRMVAVNSCGTQVQFLL